MLALPLVTERSTGIVIDAGAREARVRGHAVALTNQEFDLLSVLVTGRDLVWSREMLIETAWKDDPYVTVRTVDAVVASLRRKIEHDARYPTLLRSIGSAGYRIADSE